MSLNDDAAAPADFLTLVMPLTARAGLTKADFYDYWLNAHVTLPARFPGITTVWLHAVSFEDAIWPRLPEVSHRPPPADEFQGVPEATFAAEDGLAEFQAANKVQMDDGINFLQEIITYLSPGAATETVTDRTGVPAPDGHDGLLRHLLFLRRGAGVPAADFRRFVAGTLAPAWAGSPDLLKVRRHLFEEVEPTLDHPGVRMSKPLDRQYQAALEVVLAGRDALDRFVASPVWAQTAGSIPAYCSAVHAARVSRCITSKYRGQITLAGVRGVPSRTSSAASGPTASSTTRSATCSCPPRPRCSSEPQEGARVNSPAYPPADEMVRELWDRQQISDVRLRFGRGLDLHDWDLFASACLERLVVMHQYSNFHINTRGDEADGVFYHISRHRLPNRFGDDHYTQYGWYENSSRRTADGWRISRLKHTFQWCDGNPTLIDTSDPAWQEAAAAVSGTG